VTAAIIQHATAMAAIGFDQKQIMSPPETDAADKRVAQ
jgi:hypothetical protein